ncbi:vWA domain-containing protein [Microcella sp.]|uniref:vWA domain-containing protein n=1 Tax=Microcella sp. TaxID=1913979 RepID=UPI00391AE97C
MTLFDAAAFTVSKAKPLPVVLLLDTSGSMSGAKIASLNEAVRLMLGTFTKEESQANEFLVSIVTFGSSTGLLVPPTPASEFQYRDLVAGNGTPLGQAIGAAKQLIEDKGQTPSRAYRPLVVLVSDGQPTDSWEGPLADFVGSGRSAKCDRMALGIGEEAYSGSGRATLEKFIEGTEHKVFEAKDAGEIHNFFKFVTMSVVTRSLSQDPNAVPKDATLKPPTANPTASPTDASQEDSYW